MAKKDRYATIRAIIGDDGVEKVRKSSVLCVGAGGIGCELLKDLILCGFGRVVTIDLDTIDVSNLNRQFLFRPHHVGQSKAKVAAEAVQKLNADVKVEGIHGDIKEDRFNVKFFQQFDVVFGALDNVPARRHVNRLCIAAKVPMVESGTQGYAGHATLIIGGKTECFDCRPKPTPKTYAVCTIRQHPDKPIHCVVWAKYLFSLLFGETDDTGKVTDLAEDRTHEAYNAQSLFEKLFIDDIEHLLSMETMWKKRKPPVSLRHLVTALPTVNQDETTSEPLWPDRDQDYLTEEQAVALFAKSFEVLKKRRAREDHSLTFDKDDDAIMSFVTAATELRRLCFHVAAESPFRVKSLAGSIIPAIASSNAAVAGLSAETAIRIVTARADDCCTTYLTRGVSGGHVLTKVPLFAPNPSCFVCNARRTSMAVNFDALTLQEFAEKVLIASLSLVSPDIYSGEREIYVHDTEEDEHDEEEEGGVKRSSLLRETFKGDSASLVVSDFRQDMELVVELEHDPELSGPHKKEDEDEEEEEEDKPKPMYRILGGADEKQKTATSAPATKRERGDNITDGPTPKKTKVASNATAPKAADDDEIEVLD